MATKETVDLLITEDTRIDGKEVSRGALLTDVTVDLAYQLAGAGKARMATADEVAAVASRAKKKD